MAYGLSPVFDLILELGGLSGFFGEVNIDDDTKESFARRLGMWSASGAIRPGHGNTHKRKCDLDWGIHPNQHGAVELLPARDPGSNPLPCSFWGGSRLECSR